jgi:hypothetical protein
LSNLDIGMTVGDQVQELLLTRRKRREYFFGDGWNHRGEEINQQGSPDNMHQASPSANG